MSYYLQKTTDLFVFMKEILNVLNLCKKTVILEIYRLLQVDFMKLLFFNIFDQKQIYILFLMINTLTLFHFSEITISSLNFLRMHE